MVSNSVYACHFTTVHVRANTRNNSRLMPMAKDSGDRDAIVTMCRSYSFHWPRNKCHWRYMFGSQKETGAAEMTGDTHPVVKSFEPIMWEGPVFLRTEQICSNTLEPQTGRHSCEQQTFSNSILIQQPPVELRCQVLFISCLVPSLSLRKNWEEQRLRMFVNGPRIFMWATLARGVYKEIFTTWLYISLMFDDNTNRLIIKTLLWVFRLSHMRLFLTRCDNN